jgi:16S rRNA (cytosine1402-N4)-methyltransferase
LEALKVRPGGSYLDATLGLGGHSEEILKRSAPDGRLTGLDRDPQALARAQERLAPFGDRARLVHGDFGHLDALLTGTVFDGILADLGVSSMQLLDPVRGFSLMRDGPIDMRMDPTRGPTAKEWLAAATPDELEARLRAAGEERFALKLVTLLKTGIEQWNTTDELARAVSRTIPRRGRTHPATRVFLALRMAVNREMETLADFLDKAPGFLNPGGRLAVITFHSTEDRQVKRFYEDREGMRRLTKSPIAPSWPERKGNPRSRSALLRVFEKI